MEEVVRVDSRGRIVIPKHVRETLGIEEGSLLRLRVSGRTIVLEPIESTANRYYGAIRVRRWPRDLDEFLSEVLAEWWRGST